MKRIGRGWVYILLTLAILFAFGPVLGNGWVDWDDDINFLRNPDFRGIESGNFRWIWTTNHLGVYQPLAWTILEVERSIWGLDPRGYHLASLVLYVSTSFIIFRLFERLVLLTGSESVTPATARLGAAIAACLFAVHPLRVEVVAWASCQPYIPCVFFSTLATLLYLAAREDPDRPRRASLALAWCCVLAAVLAKAVAVTLPVVFLILDLYLLNRPGRAGRRSSGPGPGRLMLEKVPMLGISVAAIALAIWAKRASGAVAPIADYGPSARVAQSCYGVAFYLVKTILPTSLSAFYPIPPGGVSPARWPFAGALIFVLLATLLAVRLRRRWPGFLATWSAYLVILAPNAGFFRIGNHVAADRYGFAASIPWFALLACGLARLPRRLGRVARPGRLVAVLGLIVALGLGLASRRACGHWHDSLALWSSAMINGAAGSDQVQDNLGAALGEIPPSPAGLELLDGVRREQAALVAAHPADPAALSLYAETLSHVGLMLARLGRPEQALSSCSAAIACQRRARDLAPSVARIPLSLARHHLDAGTILLERGRFAEANDSFAEGLEVCEAIPAAAPEPVGGPGRSRILGALLNIRAIALAKLGRGDDALDVCRRAIEIRRRVLAASPGSRHDRSSLADNLLNLARMLRDFGRPLAVLDVICSFDQVGPVDADQRFRAASELGKCLAYLDSPADRRRFEDHALRELAGSAAGGLILTRSMLAGSGLAHLRDREQLRGLPIAD